MPVMKTGRSTGVAAISAEEAEGFGKAMGVERTTADYMDLINDPEITDPNVRVIPSTTPKEGVGIVEADRDVGVLAGEVSEDPRGEVAGRRRDGHVEPTPLDAHQFVNLLAGVFQFVADGLAQAMDDRTRLGQRDLLAGVLEQRQADAFLELFHLDRDGGLAQVKLLRGAGETELVGDRFEHLQLA